MGPANPAFLGAHLHLDAPAALPFYVRSGFVACDRKVEVYGDPRLTGVLPREAAPQGPLITAPDPRANPAVPWHNPRP